MLLQTAYLFDLFPSLYPLALSGDPKVKMGTFTQQVYRAIWNSEQDSQADFLISKSGIAFFVIHYNETVVDVVTYRFQLLENFFYTNKYVIAESKFKLYSESQTDLHDDFSSELTKAFELKSIDQDRICKFDSEFKLYDSKGNSLPITTPRTSDIMIKGIIKSDLCKINVNVEMFPNKIETYQAWAFLLIEGFISMAACWPFLQDTLFDSNEHSHFFDQNTLLINIGIDYGILFANMLISNKVLIGYQTFFLLLTLIKTLTTWNKIRAFIQINENLINNQAEENQNYMCTMLKMFMFIFSLSFFVRQLIVFYWFWLPIFLYPIFQIHYNCFYVVRKNCYHFKTHFFSMLGQTSYLIFLRIWSGSFFGLEESHSFCTSIFLLSLFFQLFMYLQKKWGNLFFFPPSLKAQYLLYKKSNTGPAFDGKDCSICLLSLALPVEGGIEQKMLPMVIDTPCRHLFHEVCLKMWMARKMSCPVCRNKLPPDYDD